MREASIWTVAIVFIGLAVLVPMINVGYEGTARPVEQTNESITVDYDTPVGVDEPGYALGFEPGAVVYNASGSVLANGTDYQWHPSNGTVTWSNTTATSDGETAQISYEYQAPPEDARNVSTILHPFEPVLGLLVLVVGVGAAFKYGTGGF